MNAKPDILPPTFSINFDKKERFDTHYQGEDRMVFFRSSAVDKQRLRIIVKIGSISGKHSFRRSVGNGSNEQLLFADFFMIWATSHSVAFSSSSKITLPLIGSSQHTMELVSFRIERSFHTILHVLFQNKFSGKIFDIIKTCEWYRLLPVEQFTNNVTEGSFGHFNIEILLCYSIVSSHHIHVLTHALYGNIIE